MKLLMLAPQPCYIDRGTPIAVDMTLATLSEAGHEVDLLTFPGGADRSYKGLRTFRVGSCLSSRPARAGLSAKKLFLDVLMLAKAIQLAATNRYTLVHAVEESSFIALVLRIVFRVPYLSDMDSRMTTQITDRFHWLKPLDKVLWAIESLPTRYARGVVTMCDSLRSAVLPIRSDNVFVVKDVSLLDYYTTVELETPVELDQIREQHRNVMMYIGNLETYQGIDLLLNAFAQLVTTNPTTSAALVIVGGDDTRIAAYQTIADQLGVGERCFFLGPQPVGMLKALMSKADILLSPRTQGTNTPLKLYSYLDSGIPVLATALQTHTQVVNSKQALLCAPESGAMADAMATLIESPGLREGLAANAKCLIQKRHSPEVFRREMLEIYRLMTVTKATNDSSSDSARSTPDRA